VTAPWTISAAARPHRRDVAHVRGLALIGEALGYLRYIRGVVAYALHIRQHLERRRYRPQVACDGLLAQQQAQTLCLDIMVELVYPAVALGYVFRKLHVKIVESLNGAVYRVLHQSAHFRYIIVHGRELAVVFASDTHTAISLSGTLHNIIRSGR
jgi:hypothetical protein